jgi:opacity protein-like surface antigen
MKRVILAAAMAVICGVPSIARAQANSEVQGFGGMTVGTATFGSAVSPTFGGRVAVGLTPHIQAIGEAGRLADISSPLFDLLDFTNIGVRVSAWYGEGGVRFIASPNSSIRPYTEATAGFARLNAGISGLSGSTDAFVNTALNVLNRTQPMLGVGGGVQLGHGPLMLDAGYRYKQISAGTTIASALNAGKPYRINQVRLGVSFRF